MFRHIVVIVMLLGIFTLVAPAWAADVEGKVQSVDASERSLVLDNGTKIWLADGIAIDAVREGAEIKVSYEEKDGKPVATSVEIK